ncbi:bifunctional epoxide hydrolase 2 [Favolaschia claudopus]|uniref:Bifunctional epoxide hydrolase 2 n=1 Tax=Favolaschia claudopus TaxID=2862362 RepID=A0AAW0DPU7_9AGAR
MLTTLKLVLLSLCFQAVFASFAFNPRKYLKSIATCPAVHRAGTQQNSVEIRLSYVDIDLNPQNRKPSLIMVHGWPGLWSTWSNQIQEFWTDYRLIVPNIRGFGESTHPGGVRSSGTIPDIVGDLVCILQHASVSSAVCVGHDWGTQVCYEAARMRPDLFGAVLGAVIPYLPSAGDFVPMEHLVSFLPKLGYQLFFDKNTPEAIAELDKDVRRSIRATLRTVASPPPEEFLKSTASYLIGWDGVDVIPPVPFFTPEEEDYFVEQYSIQGFKYTLQFYMEENRRESWSFVQKQGNFSIFQPVLSILPKNDPVADWAVASKILHSPEFLPNLRTKFMDGAHWCHIEHPTQFNALMREWLEEVVHTKTAQHDEL